MAEEQSNLNPTNRDYGTNSHASRPIVYERRSTSGSYSRSNIRQTASSPTSSISSAPIVKQRSSISDIDVKRAKKFLTRKKLALTFSGLAVVAFITGISLGISSLWLNNQAKSQVAALASKSDSDVPDENKPTQDDLATYNVAPNLARLLIIPKINVKARVTKVGVKPDNTLMSPSNIYDTGWYVRSAKPDQSGAVVIDGHVHGPTKTGVFVDLGKLRTGDKIQIEKGDHKLINYKVVKTKIYDASKVDMNAVMKVTSPGSKGLNLITCTGSVDAKTNDYEQRLVIFAIQVP